jgi:hypothetical protein
MLFNVLSVWGAILGTIGTALGFWLAMSRRPRIQHRILVEKSVGGHPPLGIESGEPYVVIEITKQGEGKVTVEYTGVLWKDGWHLPFTLREPTNARGLTESQQVRYYCPSRIIAEGQRERGPVHRYYVETTEGRRCWRVPKRIRRIV